LPKERTHSFMTLSFDNTEIAFASKSDLDLRRAWALFSMLGRKSLVDGGKKLTEVAFALHLPVKGAIKATLFRQFVGGETINECAHTIAALAKYNIGTILDYSSEGKRSEGSFEATTQELLRGIAFAKGNTHVPFAVFKVTGLARFELLEKVSTGAPLSPQEQAEYKRVEDRIDRICRAAAAAETPVYIDAEESWIQPAIDDVALRMMRRYNHDHAWVWNTIQLYRHDRLAYLKQLYTDTRADNLHLGFKLVRGAYMEKERDRAAKQGYPSPIQPDKASTDRDFDAAVDFCLQHIDAIAFCAGSHNEDSNLKLTQQMATYQIPANHPHVWFAQLLGMSDHISYNLAQAGYNVAKYVPYAPVREIVPYLIRRAEENTSVAGQTSRELSLILKEMQRRRKTV
jgi:proline dehydrogenase